MNPPRTDKESLLDSLYQTDQPAGLPLDAWLAMGRRERQARARRRAGGLAAMIALAVALGIAGLAPRTPGEAAEADPKPQAESPIKTLTDDELLALLSPGGAMLVEQEDGRQQLIVFQQDAPDS